jgi:hypothetical protein
MSIKLNFSVNKITRPPNYSNKNISCSDLYNDNNFEEINNNKILHFSGVSLINYDVNKIILPECNINGCIKEILLNTLNRNIDCLLYFNNECVILNLYTNYAKLINIQIDKKYKWILIS